MELTRVEKDNINITSATEVLSYTYTDAAPCEIIARVDLGSDSQPIVGGGEYVLNFFINNVLVTPTNTIDVPAGVTKTIAVSRPIPIFEDDVVKIMVTGLGGDTSVDTVTTLRDATPVQLTELAGNGSVAVDHDYGGADALAYKTGGGAGIAGARVRAYLTSDYDAGNHMLPFVQGQTTTITGGAWAYPLFLDPGDYTLVYYLVGQFGPDFREITVT